MGIPCVHRFAHKETRAHLTDLSMHGLVYSPWLQCRCNKLLGIVGPGMLCLTTLQCSHAVVVPGMHRVLCNKHDVIQLAADASIRPSCKGSGDKFSVARHNLGTPAWLDWRYQDCDHPVTSGYVCCFTDNSCEYVMKRYYRRKAIYKMLSQTGHISCTTNCQPLLPRVQTRYMLAISLHIVLGHCSLFS